MSIQILMPALSPTMEEGKLSKWLVKEGDTVKSGDILAEIETDKATMEFEAVDEGRIGKILVPEGTEGVKVNAPIAILLGEGEDAGAADIPTAMKSIKEAVTAETKPKPTPAAVAPKPQAVTAPVNSGARLFASPLARRIAQQKGIDLAAVAGSGPRGRIVKSDLEGAKPSAAKPVTAPVAAPQPSAGGGIVGIAPPPDARLFYGKDDYVEIPHDLMRKAIAKRLSSAAASIPHFYLTVDCRDRRTDVRARAPQRGVAERRERL